jgi:hypothetical protein
MQETHKKHVTLRPCRWRLVEGKRETDDSSTDKVDWKRDIEDNVAYLMMLSVSRSYGVRR